MPDPIVKNDASAGLVTARDPSDLAPGELTEASGGEYRVGSPHFYKQLGRTSTGATLGGPVLSLVKAQYDTAADVLLADANGTIWESAVSTAPIFSSSGVTGLSTTSVPQYTGFKDNWIRCDGIDDNLIRENAAVVGGTQGNWRVLGQETGLVPTVSGISHFSGGGQTLRPVTITSPLPIGANLSRSDLNAIIGSVDSDIIAIGGYRDPVLAIDGYNGVGIGTVSGAVAQNVIVGVNTLFLRQLTVGTVLTFSDGSTAQVAFINGNTGLTTQSNLTTTLTNSTFTYSGSNSTDLSQVTQALGYTGDNVHQRSPLVLRVQSCMWEFTGNLGYPGRVLSILHASDTSPKDWGPVFGAFGMTVAVQYCMDNVNWLSLGAPPRHQPFPDTAIEDSVSLPDTYDLSGGATPTNNLKIRAISASILGQLNGKWLEVAHAIDDIRVTTGAAVVYTAVNPIQYGISEVYTDSNLIEHRGNMGPVVPVQPSDLQNATSITLTLPTPINPLAQKFIIWRSVDTPGGGFPVMYRIAEPLVTAGTWTDTFTIRPDDTAAIATTEQYPVLDILYTTGESSTASFYSKPPLSFMSLAFQGSMCYFPSDPKLARRLYYSLPATVSSANMEQVPEQYYLDFQTPKNDTIRSAAITNGGRSMLVFFESYTMLVNYLPQSSDPGGFNNTVKEYVSNVRGCSGKMACTEFTLPAGQTLVASMDGLGVWVTNGVNLVDEWSLDLDWITTFAGVDLSAVELVDNPNKRRIELLYTDTSGNHKEYHFFYGRMKQGSEGKGVPLITGPHPMGVRCKHYTTISGAWNGFSGDKTSVGNVFLEESGTSDAAHGYNSNGDIPWSWTQLDIYPEGLSRSNILEQINLKFSDGSPKDYTLNIDYIRDRGESSTVEKTYSSGHQQQIYCHQYLDRVRVQIQDISNTAASAFVKAEYEFRDAGQSRDR